MVGGLEPESDSVAEKEEERPDEDVIDDDFSEL